MKYIRLFEERLKYFEIMVMEPKSLIDELRKEIEKDDYDLDYIKDLLYWGHFDINTLLIYDREMWTFLTKAASLNKADIVKVLLEEGADPNEQGHYAFTALIKASKEGYSQVVQELLKHPNIDPNLKDSKGNTALMRASTLGHSQVVQELLKHPNIDPNEQDSIGNNALIIASSGGHSQVVKELLKHPSINIKLTNNKGQTAWDVANPEICGEFPELEP